MNIETATEFFYECAGYYVEPGQDADDARRRCARAHAVAEAWAGGAGYTFEWEPEAEPWESFVGDGDTLEELSSVEVLLMRDPTGKVVDSLGGIGFGHDRAQTEIDRRNFMAEMALGQFHEVFGKYGVEPSAHAPGA